MAVMLIRRMDSIVMPGSRSLGADRSDRTTLIDPPLPFHDRLYRPAIPPPALCVTLETDVYHLAAKLGVDPMELRR
jgi:hypothetical protein